MFVIDMIPPLKIYTIQKTACEMDPEIMHVLILPLISPYMKSLWPCNCLVLCHPMAVHGSHINKKMAHYSYQLVIKFCKIIQEMKTRHKNKSQSVFFILTKSIKDANFCGRTIAENSIAGHGVRQVQGETAVVLFHTVDKD